MTTNLVTRKAAKAAGLLRYFTGRPCPHGHVAQRYVSTGACLQCLAVAREGTQRAAGARLRGQFAYPLHPDDHAAALAYCQSLDMARGRMPHVPPTPAPPTRPRTADEIAELRRLALGRIAEPAPDPRLAERGLYA